MKNLNFGIFAATMLLGFNPNTATASSIGGFYSGFSPVWEKVLFIQKTYGAQGGCRAQFSVNRDESGEISSIHFEVQDSSNPKLSAAVEVSSSDQFSGGSTENTDLTLNSNQATDDRVANYLIQDNKGQKVTFAVDALSPGMISNAIHHTANQSFDDTIGQVYIQLEIVSPQGNLISSATCFAANTNNGGIK